MPRAAVGSTYGRALYDNHGVLATWLPDRPLRVGDVVSRAPRTGILTVETTFADVLEGFSHESVTRKGPTALTLQRGATIDYTTSAGVPGLTAELTFTAESSFVFAARDGSSEEYSQLAPIRAALLELAGRGVWRDEWQLVTGVRRFTTCTIVIARQRGTTARVALDSTTGLTGADTIAAAAGVSITSGDASTWGTTKRTAPLRSADGGTELLERTTRRVERRIHGPRPATTLRARSHPGRTNRTRPPGTQTPASIHQTRAIHITPATVLQSWTELHLTGQHPHPVIGYERSL